MRIHMVIMALAGLVLAGCARQSDSANPRGSRSSVQAMDISSEYLPLLDKEQQAAVGRLLADSIGWRLAVDSDNSNSGLTAVRQEVPSYHPYFLRSDIDMDGRTDFAVALLRDSTISLYWFSKTDSGYSKPNWVAQATWFDECGFAEDPRPGQLFFARFDSDDGLFFHWDSSTHMLAESPDEE